MDTAYPHRPAPAPARPATALAGLPMGLVRPAGQLLRPALPALPTGHAALDAQLPGGGWPRGALIGLLPERPGCGEVTLLAPLLAQADRQHPVLLVAPPLPPHAPGWQQLGIASNRFYGIEVQPPEEILWSTRQAVSAGVCLAVLSWLPRADTAALRRLQLAAGRGRTPLFLFRPRHAAGSASPAVLRLALAARAGGLRITILKRQGPPASAPLELTLPGWPSAPERPSGRAPVPPDVQTVHDAHPAPGAASTGTRASALRPTTVTSPCA